MNNIVAVFVLLLSVLCIWIDYFLSDNICIFFIIWYYCSKKQNLYINNTQQKQKIHYSPLEMDNYAFYPLGAIVMTPCFYFQKYGGPKVWCICM